ncbi:helix-turn-helix domain-containing protein [Salmonirosea aquatica]|uniref:Helix-turn-helix domain-containing protein n=1 Tax=Salmonirosea aquatica TaxID=2654236 RepID=A0A7C9FG22_9BACT|nr:helix-turn-helix domain-containing protein [Cytophagaceae bacterium SJW1-29]
MQRFHLQEPLSIRTFELDQWTTPDRPPDCYTLILVLSGEGYHTINGNQFAYFPGDVFYLSVQDQYNFRITQRTKFCWLSFSTALVSKLRTTGDHAWNYLNLSISPCPGPIAPNSVDQGNLQGLAAILLSETKSLRPLISNPIIEGLVKTLLSLVDRLLTQRGAVAIAQSTYSSDVIQRVIAYINQNIGEPHRLRMDTLADEFNYSPGHLNALFRQHAGDSIRQFIMRHKLKLVAIKLRNSSLTVSQIADEFGFTDVCHLNKHFKRHYKHTPTLYRQSFPK